MPRIRKKTSKRGTTHQRSKIKQKAAESRKKSKRDEKKNPQWKSKQKKDPGIPNSFPFKDQILAEVAEERRQAEEAKQLKKDKKKALKGRADNVEDDGSESGFVGISSIPTGSAAPPGTGPQLAKGKEKASTEDAVAEDSDPSLLLDSEFGSMKAVLDKADVVLQVVDARDPLPCRSASLESWVKERATPKGILVLNKIDACPREAIQLWTKNLRDNLPTVLFRSASAFLPQTADQRVLAAKNGVTRSASDGLGVDVVLKVLANEATQKETGDLLVAVIGVANAGKSSLINSLVGKAACPVYEQFSSASGPSTTTHPREAILTLEGKRIRLVDTPALSWKITDGLQADEIAAVRAQDMLLRSKGRIDKVKDPLPAVQQIISRAEPEDMMLFYNVPAFTKGDDNTFLAGVARSNGLIKKGGAPDLTSAARIVLRDWSTGKFPRFTNPPPASLSATTPDQNADASHSFWTELYTADKNIFDQLQTRKELRKGAGLVKLSPGSVELREAELEGPWTVAEDVSNTERGGHPSARDEDDEGSAVESGSSDGDEDEDEQYDGDMHASEEDELDNDDDQEPPSLLSGKRKRRDRAHSAPSKKVAFASDTKTSTSSKRSNAPPKTKPSTKKTITTAASGGSKVSSKGDNTVANTKRHLPNVHNGEEAYDFGRFF